jgi:Flp pilus assembly protein TadG
VSRTRRGDRGQATVELALVLPLVALLVLLVLQAGLVIRDQLLVAHAAREAARAASVAEGDRGAAARRGAERAGGLDPAHLVVRTASGDGGEAVVVQVTYESVTAVPLVGLLLPDIALKGQAVMRVEAPAG